MCVRNWRQIQVWLVTLLCCWQWAMSISIDAQWPIVCLAYSFRFTKTEKKSLFLIFCGEIDYALCDRHVLEVGANNNWFLDASLQLLLSISLLLPLLLHRNCCASASAYSKYWIYSTIKIQLSTSHRWRVGGARFVHVRVPCSVQRKERRKSTGDLRTTTIPRRPALAERISNSSRW